MASLHLLPVKLALHFVYDSLNAKLYQHLLDKVKARLHAFRKYEQNATDQLRYLSQFRAAKRMTQTTGNSRHMSTERDAITQRRT
jgi:hypothetical protein